MIIKGLDTHRYVGKPKFSLETFVFNGMFDFHFLQLCRASTPHPHPPNPPTPPPSVFRSVSTTKRWKFMTAVWRNRDTLWWFECITAVLL